MDLAKGPCNPENREACIKSLRESIDAAAEVGCTKVITFTGMKFEGMDRDQAIKNCLDVWKGAAAGRAKGRYSGAGAPKQPRQFPPDEGAPGLLWR